MQNVGTGQGVPAGPPWKFVWDIVATLYPLEDKPTEMLFLYILICRFRTREFNRPHFHGFFQKTRKMPRSNYNLTLSVDVKCQYEEYDEKFKIIDNVDPFTLATNYISFSILELLNVITIDFVKYYSTP